MTEFGEEDNQTLYIGNLDSKVTEEHLYELFLQAGPIKSVTIPKDKITKKSRSFGFVCFKDEVSMPYAYYLLRDIPLFGRPLKIQSRNKRFNFPPIYCVGVHTLEPKIGQDNESQEAEARDSQQQEQQKFIHNVGQSPNPFFPSSLIQPYYMPNNCNNNNANGSPAIDTNSLNNFKHSFENSPQQHNSNRYNRMSDQFANFNNQFNNGGNGSNDAHNRSRSHGGGRFSGDNKHLSPRLSGRLEFPTNGRNNGGSPYNSRNSSPISNNNNSPYQGHNNSHQNNYSRHNNSYSNFSSPYNDRNCNSPSSPYYNRSFNNSRNNNPYNDRDRSYDHGKRDSYGNDDRRDSRRSREGGGSSSSHHYNQSFHNDRNQRRY